MNYPYSNLPMGVTSHDISPCEICSKCGREIQPNESHVWLVDEPLIDGILCESCAQDREPDEPDPEPTNLQMCLVMGYWGMSTAWDWAKAKVWALK